MKKSLRKNLTKLVIKITILKKLHTEKKMEILYHYQVPESGHFAAVCSARQQRNNIMRKWNRKENQFLYLEDRFQH